MFVLRAQGLGPIEAPRAPFPASREARRYLRMCHVKAHGPFARGFQGFGA